MILGLRWYGPVAVVVLIVSTVLMARHVDPFHDRYYMFAWYSYIFFADSLIYRIRGRSLISNHFREFLLMLPLSFLVWEMFEGFDLRLKNWHYAEIVNGEPVKILPHPGNYHLYFIAFATVLPGEFVTLDLIRTWAQRSNNWLNRAHMRRWELTDAKIILFIALGGLCLALALIWPVRFFPLMWIWAFLIIDPINYRLGRPSILHQMSKGSGALFFQILVAGMICGGLWELWNFWAGTKWIYTVPAPLDRLRIFEMPILGYFGFPPFALECFALYHFLISLPGLRRIPEKPSFVAYRDEPIRETVE